MTPLLEAEGLGHRFGPNWLFRGVDLAVHAGDRLAILGRNGTGKSTLLRVLAGQLRPREGWVRSPEPAYAALDMNLYPTLSGAEHLALAQELRGGAATPTEWLTRVGLPRAAFDRPVGAYSTGMRSRLRLALALAAESPLLLLDEPTAALDEPGREVVNEVIRTFEGAVVMATNDPEDRRLATHELDLG